MSFSLADAVIATIPMRSTEIGTPCRLGEAVGRIVDHDPEGSFGMVNGVKMWSIVLWGTPHGSVVKSGIHFLHSLKDEEMNKLVEFEKDAKEKGILYQNHSDVAKLIDG